MCFGGGDDPAPTPGAGYALDDSYKQVQVTATPTDQTPPLQPDATAPPKNGNQVAGVAGGLSYKGLQ